MSLKNVLAVIISLNVEKYFIQKYGTKRRLNKMQNVSLKLRVIMALFDVLCYMLFITALILGEGIVIGISTVLMIGGFWFWTHRIETIPMLILAIMIDLIIIALSLERQLMIKKLFYESESVIMMMKKRYLINRFMKGWAKDEKNIRWVEDA